MRNEVVHVSTNAKSQAMGVCPSDSFATHTVPSDSANASEQWEVTLAFDQ
ncbi:MAG: hypothetical protein ACQETI_07505 [Halobacteriota archaeon]